MQRAFKNWRVPGYAGSLAYRVQRVSPALFRLMMNGRFVLQTRTGASLVARLRDVNAPAEVFGAGEYSDAALDWRNINYVLDVGAHVGGFALWASIMSPGCEIACLEPNPDVRQLLERNVVRNHLGSRIKVHPWALAAGHGSARLRRMADSAASALVAETASGDVDVGTITLAEAIGLSGFPRVDLLKIDIEGAEHDVFADDAVEALRCVGSCVVECHPRAGVRSERVAECLRAAGFDVTVAAKPQQLLLLTARRASKQVAV